MAGEDLYELLPDAADLLEDTELLIDEEDSQSAQCVREAVLVVFVVEEETERVVVLEGLDVLLGSEAVQSFQPRLLRCGVASAEEANRSVVRANIMIMCYDETIDWGKMYSAEKSD